MTQYNNYNMSKYKWLFSTIYFTVFWLFFNSSSIFLFWLNMEINLFIFIMIMISEYNEKSSFLYFFVIQTLTSVSFMYVMLFDTFLDNKNLQYEFILILLSLKMSLFPFHNWGNKFCMSTSSYIFYLFMTFQKFPMFFLILMSTSAWILMSILNMFMGSILAIFSLSFTSLIFYSSIYMTVWITFVMYSSLNTFLILMIFYLGFLFSMTMKKDMNFKLNKFFMLMTLIFFFSMPPFSMFFLKLFIFELMIKMFGYTITLMSFLSSFMILFAYTKFFLAYMSKDFNYNKISVIKSIWLQMYMLIWSIIFML